MIMIIDLGPPTAPSIDWGIVPNEPTNVEVSV
jgi:hypothetical protein